MQLFRKKKKEYVLMHKDIPVLSGTYDFSRHGFAGDVQIINEKHLPVGSLKDGKLSMHRLHSWNIWRGIPTYRVGLNQLLSRLEVNSPLDLLEREHMLSLSDTYWLKGEDEKVSWDQINFFNRPFDDRGFSTAMFARVASHADRSARHTPNNTTAGYHRKAWIRQENGLYLIKGGSPVIQQEPVNEWMASCIAEKLGIQAVHYDTCIYEDWLVSICPLMTDEHTDLVPAKDVLRNVEVPKGQFAYSYYVECLKQHGINDGAAKLSDQAVLDYLMLNTDRHDQNLGVLIDADTMEWKGCAPVFDTGTGLGCLVNDEEVRDQEQAAGCRLFNASSFSHEELLNLICFDRYDFTGLENLAVNLGNQLVKYQPVTHISNQRIEDIYQLFYKRILRLKKAAAEAQ